MIEALIISCQEPQLPRCLESVYNQDTPFKNIIHVDNVIPEAEAFKQGLSQLTGEWVMIVNGDMILYPNASSQAEVQIWIDENEKVSEFQYGLYDPFVERVINSCSVYKVEPLVKEGRSDTLRNDLWASRNIMKDGWIRRSLFTGPNPIVIGTHCEHMDDFQIFRRFFTVGVKGNGYPKKVVEKLYRRTRDRKYELAIRAIEFGYKNKFYPGSHNIEFDRKMYEKFNEDIDRYSSPEQP